MINVKIDSYFAWGCIYWFCGLWAIHIPVAMLWLVGKWVGDSLRKVAV
jgi:hypothetical protein